MRNYSVTKRIQLNSLSIWYIYIYIYTDIYVSKYTFYNLICFIFDSLVGVFKKKVNNQHNDFA